MTKKYNLKDHLNDDTLDLSLSNLQDVPVKEIAAIPKVTSLDLSSNKLTELSESFPAMLTHLVKLDLCHNEITVLPENFGLLVHLKHLDLYMNKLTTLPLSFGNLKSLKWLDLKDNPLVPKMAHIVGPCADATQCQAAARKAVAFLADLNKKVLEEKKRRLEEKLLQEERDRENQAKKDAKLKRKKKKGKVSETADELTENGNHLMDTAETENDLTEAPEENVKIVNKNRCSVFGFFGKVTKVLALVLMLLCLSLFIISLIDDESYQVVMKRLNDSWKQASGHLPKSVVTSWQRARTWTTGYTKLFVKNFLLAFRSGVVQLNHFYQWMSTNERIQVYVETLKHYWHITYIKMTELLLKFSNSVSSYVNS